MRPVKTYTLTVWLPFLIVTVFVLLFGIQLYYQASARKTSIILNSQQEVYETGLQLAHNIEYALKNNDLDQANSHIMRFSLRRDADSLNKHADTAIYRAKHDGRNQYQFLTEKMHSQIVYKRELEHALRFAL